MTRLPRCDAAVANVRPVATSPPHRRLAAGRYGAASGSLPHASTISATRTSRSHGGVMSS
jgi:hypothetical protein